MAPDVLLPDAPGGRDALTPLEGGRTHGFAGEAMGTGFTVSVVLADAAMLPAVERRFERVLATVIAQMSQWEPDSQISRFNAAAPGSQMEIGPQFAQVLDCALALARASEGAFDPTLGAASEAWGFGTSPAPATRPRQAPAGRWRELAFEPATRALVQAGGLQLDLSGIAKGFAVDMAVAALQAQGARHLLVEIGGELRAAGVQPDGQPWWVDCEAVPGSAEPPARIALSGWAVATSGDWHRRRQAGGASWSHTLRPETGQPIEGGLRAATVIHRGCMQADGIATALMVMGEEQGLAWADRHRLAARLTNARGVAVDSARWRQWCSA